MEHLIIKYQTKQLFGCILIVLLSLSISSCYYDVEENIYPTVECDTTNISYTETILPIISNNCYACHDQASNFGGITLEGYDRLKTYVDNGGLLGVIKHESGFSPMPKNQAKLIDCDIEKIETWINDGAKDQFGNSVAPRDLKPQMAGMVVKSGATTFARGGNYNPVNVPAGTGNVTIYFAYLDDKTPQNQFTVNTVDTSQNPGLYLSGNSRNLTKLGSALTMPGLFGIDRDYWYSIDVNVSSFQADQVLWFKTRISDNVNPALDIPGTSSNFNNQKYFAIKFN